MKPIKIVTADDNIYFCKFLNDYLKKYEDIEILGIANDDNDEISMIEELKPDIVITDLMREHKYTGLDIIKRYKDRKQSPQFLVISGDFERDIIDSGMKVAGYIRKPVNDYNKIYTELRRIRNEAIDREYEEWSKKYHNVEIVDIRHFLTWKDKKTLKKLGIKIKNKKYTEYEIECLTMDLLAYYDDPEMDLSEEEKQFQKSLEDTKVSREEYNLLLDKVQKINEKL